jgi:hypothetical protein
MAWSSGKDLFSQIVTILKNHVSDEDERHDVYIDLVEIFEAHDCDNLAETYGEDYVLDEVLVEVGIVEEDDIIEEDE